MYQKRSILFAISMLLLAALFYTIDYNEFYRIASKVELKWIAALIALQLIIMLLMSLKWYIIIRRYAVSFRNVLLTSMIGFMVNSLTPVNQAGGEPVRAYVISKIDRIKMEKAFATVVVDLFLGTVPVLLLILSAIVFVFMYSLDLRIAWLLAFIGAVIITLGITSFNILTNHEPSLKLFNRLLDIFGRVGFLRERVDRIESQVDELFGSFHRSIRSTMTATRTLSMGLFVSTLIWALSLLRVYIIFHALGVSVAPQVVVIVYAVLVTVSILPLLPGALGMWEWVGTGLFAFFGIPLEAAVAVTLLDRLLFYWLPMFTGFASSLHVGLNVMRLVERQG